MVYDYKGEMVHFNTDKIDIYRRERTFSSNKIKKKMKKIDSIIFDNISESRGQKTVTFVDKDVKSQGIVYEYRLVSSNENGESYDFFDLVSKSSSSNGGSFKQGKTENNIDQQF